MEGYGVTGKMIARHLVQHTSAELVLAGRNENKALDAALELNSRWGQDRVKSQYADASDPSSLKAIFATADLVVAASCTSQYTPQIASAAIETGTDYFDIQYSAYKMSVLKSLEPDIVRAGRCFITDGGFHPGLAAVLVHQAAVHFDTLETANVGSVIKIDWRGLNVSEGAILELADELKSFDTSYFSEGLWKKGGMRKMNFGQEFGSSRCTSMMLEKMYPLPVRYPSLSETGFYVGGFNWFVDWLVLPAGIVALWLFPRKALKPVSKFMHWGLLKFSKPPYGTILKIEAAGIKNGRRATFEQSLYHEDGYELTAIPVAAAIRQYLDGSIRRAGLWTQANLVQGERLLKDMQDMGVLILKDSST
ncbi:saccharopine dehydrogenase NADP-binding domain-containing protein [Paenibacillus sp. M1]|uniref:Saccharopine dehydrogenase NADP-binding domain-containing protein n=1 Tax=Paenibacillus haidiansis TaxID=1574488 RepID=A0ABU7VTA4_9BACL